MYLFALFKIVAIHSYKYDSRVEVLHCIYLKILQISCVPYIFNMPE